MQKQINNTIILGKNSKGYIYSPAKWKETNKNINTNKNKTMTKNQAREKTKKVINDLAKK